MLSSACQKCDDTGYVEMTPCPTCVMEARDPSEFSCTACWDEGETDGKLCPHCMWDQIQGLAG